MAVTPPDRASAAGPPPALSVTLPDPAKAAILVDVDTGRVLWEQNAHDPLPPGSLTKTLTAMIATAWLPPISVVPVTAVAYNAYPDKVGMSPGQKWPLGIVLHALITDSANDAAYALAVDIGGSLAGFAPVMQEAAAQIGLSDHPVLEDPAGLDGTEGFDGGNRISAWDLSIMGRDMMAEPELAAIAGQETYDFEGPDGIAYHLVSRNYNFLATYADAIGVKTGFTDAAGYCDMEEADRQGRHVLAVVLNSTNPDADSAALITAGFTEPVTAESGDPQLPAVTRPHKPRPAGEVTRAATPPGAAAAGNDPAKRVAAAGPVQVGGGTNDLITGLAVAGVVVAAGIWARKLTRRRRPRPARRATPPTRPAGEPTRR